MELSQAQRTYAEMILKKTAREIKKDSRLNSILAHLAMSMGHVMRNRNCIKCIGDALKFIKNVSLIDVNENKNGKVLSAV